MQSKTLKISIVAILLMVFSCDEPETLVTNYVHPDGSVTRKIEMRNVTAVFDPSKFQVSIDSTWNVRDSIEINDKGDTTWVKRAEKLFSAIDEINAAYASDSGCNKVFSRSASFKKSFRWFNTTLRFSENIGSLMSFGGPVNEYLNPEELAYFYSPQSLQDKQDKSADSLKYRSIKDSVEFKSEVWISNAAVQEWIGHFSKLTEGSDRGNMIDSLKKQQPSIAKMIREKFNGSFDSLWKEGVILKSFIGEENSVKFRSQADSALTIVSKELFTDFKNYSVRTVMPGKLTGTNGFIDSTRVLIWPIATEYFLTQPYEMWAESKITNGWAWIVSALFLLFVLTGVIIKIKKG